MQDLLVATGNQGKVKEFADMLSDLAVGWKSLKDLGITADIPENGSTFIENATIKALGYQKLSGMLTLADDSGLEVDALDGAPGIYSARYGGDLCRNDAERYRHLLLNLRSVPVYERTARFRCAIVLAGESGVLETAEGTFEGHIAYRPKGTNGFGYDPVFFVTSEGKMLAELSADHKHEISHRGNALRILAPKMGKWLN